MHVCVCVCLDVCTCVRVHELMLIMYTILHAHTYMYTHTDCMCMYVCIQRVVIRDHVCGDREANGKLSLTREHTVDVFQVTGDNR